MKNLFLLSLWIGFQGVVAEEMSAFEKALQQDAGVRTRESIEVDKNGIRYRRVETDKGVYYLKMIGRTDEISDVDCDMNYQSDHLVEGSVAIINRTRLFVSTLQEYCYKDERGQRRQSLNVLSTQIGVQLPDNKGDRFTNKRIFTDPLIMVPNAGFRTDF